MGDSIKTLEKYEGMGVCLRCGKLRERFKKYCTKCLRQNAIKCSNYYKRNRKQIKARIQQRRKYNKRNHRCVDCGHRLERSIEKGLRCINCSHTVIRGNRNGGGS